MRALDASQTHPKNSSDSRQCGTPLPTRMHRCKNPDCPNEFPHRTRGGNDFCSADCRQYYHQATQNARSATRHLKIHLSSPSQRGFMRGILAEVMTPPYVNVLEALPSSSPARRDSIWNELEALDSLMLTKGPCDPAVRAHIKTRAGSVAAALVLEKSLNLADRLLLVRTHELLRDLGTEGPPSAQSFAVLLGHATAAIRYFEEIHDFANLGRSLIALGNVHRLADDEPSAVQKFRWAFHILHERCDSRDPSVARLLHQVRFWRLRTTGQKLLAPWRIRNEMAHLTRLAQQVNDPCIWIEHHREAAGFASFLLDDSDLASQRLQDMGGARRQLTNHTTWGDPTLVTPRILLLFETHRHEEAIDLIRRSYIPLYFEYPNLFNYRRILHWSRDYKFNVSISPPRFASAFLSYLPRRTNELV